MNHFQARGPQPKPSFTTGILGGGYTQYIPQLILTIDPDFLGQPSIPNLILGGSLGGWGDSAAHRQSFLFRVIQPFPI